MVSKQAHRGNMSFLKKYFLHSLAVLSKLRTDDHLSSEMLRGSVSSFILKSTGLLFGYLFIFLLSNNYGAEAVGNYSLSMTMLRVLSMLVLLGMNTSIVKYSGQNSSESLGWSVKMVHRKMVIAVLSLGVAVGVLCYFSSDLISHYVFKDGDLSLSLRIIAIGLPFFSLCTLNAEALRGMKLIKQYDFFLYTGVIIFSAIILWLTFPPSQPLFGKFLWVSVDAIGNSIGISVVILSYLFFSFASLRYVSNGYREFDGKGQFRGSVPFKSILLLSLPMMATSYIYLLNSQVDKIMIGMLKGTADVGIYNVALRLATLTSLGLSAINSIAAPKIARFFSQKNTEAVNKVLRFSARTTFWGSLPFFFLCIFFPKFLLGIFGNEFTAGSVVLTVLVVGQLVNACCGSVGVVLNMTGHQIIFRNIIFWSMILNVLTNIILIPTYGIVGAAIATAVSTIFWNVTAVYYCKRFLEIRTFYLPFIR